MMYPRLSIIVLICLFSTIFSFSPRRCSETLQRFRIDKATSVPTRRSIRLNLVENNTIPSVKWEPAVGIGLLASASLLVSGSNFIHVPIANAAVTGLAASPSVSNAEISSLFSFIENYSRFYLAGAICCTISHGLTVPFDVVKTRIQVNEGLSDKDKSVIGMAKLIVEKEGVSMLLKGMAPTLGGYALQGAIKYGSYEVFKPLISQSFAELFGFINTGDLPLKILILLLAGGLADTLGSLVLTPFEAARIRLVANPSFANGLLPTINKIVLNEGYSSLFKSLPVILARQVPYTMVQLCTFEIVTSYITSIYGDNMLLNSSTPSLFLVNLVAALIAAFFAAIVSQPGDTLCSVVNKQSSPSSMSSSLQVIKNSIDDLGIAGLFRGFKARLVHVGFIVVVQLLVYDYVKHWFGITSPH